MNSSDNNEPLRDTLRAWKLSPEANPNFRPEVWARIRGQSQRATLGAYVRGHAAGLALAAVFTLSLSGWVGHAAGRAKIDAAREAMVISYLVDLDPRVQASLRR